jgi:hypothetical protein
MKKIFFLPLLILAFAVCSQTNDTSIVPVPTDSFDIKFQRIKDSVEKTVNDINWENNRQNMEDVMKMVDKNKKKEKRKAIIYIVIGVGMLLVLIFGLMRRRAGRKT